MLQRGSLVRVIAPDSVFQGLEGVIREVRTPPLPFGVKLKKRPRTIWFHEGELEEVKEEKAE